MRISAYTQAMNSYKTYQAFQKAGNGVGNSYSNLMQGISKNTTSSMDDLAQIANQYADFKASKTALKAYYSSMAPEDIKSQFSGLKSASNGVTSSVSTGSTTSTNAQVDTKLANAAADLKKSAEALAVDKENQLMSTVGDVYTKQNVVDAINNFATSYNKVISASENTSSTKASAATDSMKNTTSLMKNSLEKVGITVNKDNTLTVDEAKLKAADKKDVSSLFNGRSSYAYGVAQQAARVQANASTNVSNYYNANTYSFGAMVNTYA